MRKWGILIVLSALLCSTPLGARDILDELAEAVDQLEGCFWSGFFHASGHARRDRCNAAVEKVQNLARDVQAERKNQANLNAGNPTKPAMEVVSLLRSSHHAGTPISIPAQKSTRWGAFLKEFRQAHPVKKGTVPTEPSRDDYEGWLQRISDDNASKFSQGVRTGTKISKLQRGRLLGIDQKYRNAIVALRLAIFDLRHSDPAFMPAEKEAPKPAHKKR